MLFHIFGPQLHRVIVPKRSDRVLEFLGSAYIFHEFVCVSQSENVIHITWIKLDVLSLINAPGAYII